MTAGKRNKITTFPLILLTMLVATSCSLQQPFEFGLPLEEYAESLYKRQNQATQILMLLLEEELQEDDEETLSTAELQMYDSCHLLNQMVAYEQEGKTASLAEKRQLRNSFPACEQAISQTEFLLTELENKIE